jgi:hypothetical protein
MSPKYFQRSTIESFLKCCSLTIIPSRRLILSTLLRFFFLLMFFFFFSFFLFFLLGGCCGSIGYSQEVYASFVAPHRKKEKKFKLKTNMYLHKAALCCSLLDFQSWTASDDILPTAFILVLQVVQLTVLLHLFD